MQFWIRFSFINLWIVAALGVLMRYKIGFEFPYFNQKYLQHAHSHFAFVGWISHTLFVLMVLWIQPYLNEKALNKYKALILLNLICAYGMLISFAIQGYGFFSINLSTYSIFVTYFFANFFIKDLKQVPAQHPAKNWFKAALWFNVISSIGTFYLAYMMATHNFQQDLYLASVYFYLHFQYNGWFFFACVGLFSAWMFEKYPQIPQSSQTFWLFALACVPAYFLSTLWYAIPAWLYSLAILAAFVQVIAWGQMPLLFQKNRLVLSAAWNTLAKLFFIGIAIAVSIKLMLQLGSTIPIVSKLAFGFRAIVIAYLHLIFLVIVSFFLIVFLYIQNHIPRKKLTHIGLVLFGLGVFLNELILAIQGIGAFSYTIIPYSNESLLLIACLIWSGVWCLLIGQISASKPSSSVSL